MAIWNPKTKTWEEDNVSSQIWDPKSQQWSKSTELNIESNNKSNKKKQSNTIGNIANTAISTVANTGVNLLEGAVRDVGERTLDFANNASSNINTSLEYGVRKLLGYDEKTAKKIKEEDRKANREFVSRDLTTELKNKVGFDEEAQRNFEKNSLVKHDNLGGKIAQGIGGMLPSIAVGRVTNIGIPLQSLKGLKGTEKAVTAGKNVLKAGASNIGGNTVLAGGAYGNALETAYKEGANEEQATRYAIGSTVKEIATEWITGGIPGLKGTGGLDKPVKSLIDKSTGKLKNEYAQAISKTLLNYGYKFGGEGFEEGLSEYIDPYLKNATFSENEKVNWEDVLNSFIIGGIVGGILEAPNSVSELRSNLNTARVNSQNSATLPTGLNNNQAETQNVEGNPLIENNNPVSLPVDQNTMNRMNAQSNMNSQTLQDNINIQDTNDNINNVDSTLLDQNISRYSYEESDNPKINNLRQSASQYMNNSGSTKSFIETAEKVIKDKDYNITFDDSIGDNINGRIRINENGEVDIKINPNSERAGEFLLVHEITHAIETKEMKDVVMDYASKNKDFNNALESLKKTYGVNDVSDEVLADISGQILGNEEFINKLSTSKPNIFKKVYDMIISLANKITGNSKESLFIKDLKNKWENAYRTANNKSVINNLLVEKYHLSKNAKNEVEDAVNNPNSDQNSMVKLRDFTPKKLTDYGVNDLPMLVRKGHLRENILTEEEASNKGFSIKNKHFHGIGIKTYLDVIDSLDNPIAVYRYTDNGKYSKDNFVILTNIENKDGEKIIVPVEINKSGQYNKVNFDINRIKTVYGRETDNYFKNKVASGEMIELKDKKRDAKPSLQSGSLSTSTENNIPQNEQKINKNDILSNKYSMQETDNNTEKLEWQKHLEENYKSRGVKTYFEDTRLKENVSATDKVLNKEKEKISNKYVKEQKTTSKIITKEATKILEFDDYKQKRKFTELLSNYYDKPDFNQIKQDIIDNFSEKRKEYQNEYLKEIKSQIRQAELKVPDYVKKSIIDYNTFRKSNMGKLKLTKKGQSIDSFYSEISEMYPSLFSKAITNEVDQLKRLSEFMDSDSSIIEKYKLDEDTINNATQYVYDALKNKDNIDDLINSISISTKQIRKEKTIEYRELASNFLENSDNWKDKKMGLSYKINTMKRNFYDVMGKKDGNRLYKNFIEPIFNHNAEMQKDISNYNDKIGKLKLNEKESIAVQMFGEYKYNPETLVTGMEVDEFISKNKLDYKKIEKAVEVFRSTYDELIERVNETLKSQGYKEIEYRKGYFPHFVDEGAQTKFGKILEKMGWKFKDDSIPTDIAGITDTFKPGKVWNRNAQQRKGKYTDFNALKGFDNYVRGAMETIYFTEDIQKLRALENEIRYQHSEKGVQNQIDEILNDNTLDYEDRQDKIDKIFAKYMTPLNNFVSELRDYTNTIANKKSIMDRTMEQATNRKIYSVMTNINSRLSANMVGMNLSSAITNFIPITQATSQVKSKYLMRGLKEAIKAQRANDGFESKSVFLTSRLNEAERLYKTKLEKASEKMNFMFNGIDSITANTIVRGKYYENLANGMSEYNAMRNADEFARDLISGRTKGEMPTIFNSKNPFIKLFTSFQLEVNNQFGYMFKDLPRDVGDESKKKLIAAFAKMFFGAWIYNQLTQLVMGRKSAFSPADTIQEIFETATNRNLRVTDKSVDILKSLTENIPFVGGLIGGGRLPINSVANPLNVAKGESTIGDELKKLGYYTVLPFGGGQLKKSIEGASMYINDKEVKGSYTSKDKLRFEAKSDPISVGRNIVFGQYSSKEAQEYFNKGYLPIDEKTVEKLQKKGISISEYRKYSDYSKELDLNKIESDKDSEGKTISGSASSKKALKIINSDYSDKAKNYLLSTLNSSENSVTIKELSNIKKDEKSYLFYFGLNEKGRKTFNKELKEYNISSDKLIDYYNSRKEYKDTYSSNVAKSKIMDYLNKSNLDEKTKWYLYSKDYGSDNITKIADSFNIKTKDYFSVMNYAEDINWKLRGTKNSSKRKREVFNYINSLKLNKVQKCILYKQAGYSDKTSQNIVRDYIDSMNLNSYEKKQLYDAIY